MRRIDIAYDPLATTFRSASDMLAALESGSATIIGDTTAPEKPPAPGLLKKAANFAASAAKHVAAGMPMASEEDVVRRFAICQGCEHFDGRACRLCGCPVVREKAFVSKLSWAGEECPAGKWGKVTGKQPESQENRR